MGRKKISIEKIEDLDKRYVAFSKRKEGLFKKASTACRMYGSQIAIIIFSPTAGRLHTFGPVDALIDKFLHHSSSSSSFNPPPPQPINSFTTTYDYDHIEEGKKRSRSYRDDIEDDLITEIETKKMKFLMSSEAATVQEEEKEVFLLTNFENKNMGFEEELGITEEEPLVESQTTEQIVVATATATASTTTTASVADSSYPLVSDYELNETLLGFADYIMDNHHHEEQNMFDMLPHEGIYDEDLFPIF